MGNARSVQSPRAFGRRGWLFALVFIGAIACGDLWVPVARQVPEDEPGAADSGTDAGAVIDADDGGGSDAGSAIDAGDGGGPDAGSAIDAGDGGDGGDPCAIINICGSSETPDGLTLRAGRCYLDEERHPHCECLPGLEHTIDSKSGEESCINDLCIVARATICGVGDCLRNPPTAEWPAGGGELRDGTLYMGDWFCSCPDGGYMQPGGNPKATCNAIDASMNDGGM